MIKYEFNNGLLILNNDKIFTLSDIYTEDKIAILTEKINSMILYSKEQNIGINIENDINIVLDATKQYICTPTDIDIVIDCMNFLLNDNLYSLCLHYSLFQLKECADFNFKHLKYRTLANVLTIIHLVFMGTTSPFYKVIIRAKCVSILERLDLLNDFYFNSANRNNEDYFPYEGLIYTNDLKCNSFLKETIENAMKFNQPYDPNVL